jgi:hypothetical protein
MPGSRDLTEIRKYRSANRAVVNGRSNVRWALPVVRTYMATPPRQALIRGRYAVRLAYGAFGVFLEDRHVPMIALTPNALSRRGARGNRDAWHLSRSGVVSTGR